MASRPEIANIKHAIAETGGVITDLARHFRVTRRTIYNWLDHYSLRGEVEKARAKMRDVAEDVLYGVLIADPEADIQEIEKKRRLSDKDKFKLELLYNQADTTLNRQVSVAKFTLQHTNSQGKFIPVSDEVIRLLPAAGLTLEGAAQIFEEMVRAAAKQKMAA